jgi:flagellin
MVINTNIMAQNAANALQSSEASLATSLQRLSTGSKIVSPADDAAGLAVATELNAQISRTGAAQTNVTNAISFNQTQDGYLQQVSNALSRMSELAIESQDVTKSNSDRSLYQAEFSKLGAYINDIATKNFNGVSLFNGTTLNVTTDSEGKTVGNTGVNLTAGVYTTAAGDSVATSAGAATALTDVESAITQLSTDRANIGANISVLNNYNSTLSTLQTNLSSATSQITDVDVAQESTQYARYNILVQSGTAMLAQANQVPQSVLKLIGG